MANRIVEGKERREEGPVVSAGGIFAEGAGRTDQRADVAVLNVAIFNNVGEVVAVKTCIEVIDPTEGANDEQKERGQPPKGIIENFRTVAWRFRGQSTPL